MFETRRSQRVLCFALSYVFLGLVGATMLFPLLWMLATSLKAPEADAMDMRSLFPGMSYQLKISDIHDWNGFCRRLSACEGPSGKATMKIFSHFSSEEREAVATVMQSAKAGPPPKITIINALNRTISREELFDIADIDGLPLAAPVRDFLKTKPCGLAGNEMKTRNRVFLDSIFPLEIRKAHRFQWENYRTVFIETKFLTAFLNSIFVTLAVAAGQVLTSSLAAFAFARLDFFGRDKLFLGYLATMMVPMTVTIIPVFILLRSMGQIDTYFALIAPSVFSAYGTFMLRQFFLGIPKSLEEAAEIDGCSLWQIYWHVVLPLSKTALATLAILTFMGSWKSFMWPLIVTHSEELFTIPVALAQFQEMYKNILGVQWSLLMAGSIIMILPMLGIFILGQRFFVEGISVSAVKG